MIEYATNHGQDVLLKYFLTIIATPEENPTPSLDLTTLAKFEKKSKEEKDEIATRVHGLADNLVDHFFLPCEYILY